MYTDEAITLLAKSVGFGLDTTNTISIVEPNLSGSSGMLFSSFHNLVQGVNLSATMNIQQAQDETKLNVDLTQIRMDAARKVLSSIFDSHIDYVDGTDYSQIIEDKLVLLRKPYAYAVAATVIEGMVSSKRSNLTERSVKESYSFLKIELEGAKNDFGKRLSYGLLDKFNFAVRDAQKVIFPKRPTIEQSENTW